MAGKVGEFIRRNRVLILVSLFVWIALTVLLVILTSGEENAPFVYQVF